MKRLTSDTPLTEAEAMNLSVTNLYARLKEYENTGLEPEEAEACKVALMGKTLAEIKEIEGLSIERMKELAKAEAEGRLLILPCKVGDTVYCLRCSRMRLDEGEINEILVSKIHGVRLWVKFKNNGVQQVYTMREIGQLVFLNREEAEAALRGGVDG